MFSNPAPSAPSPLAHTHTLREYLSQTHTHTHTRTHTHTTIHQDQYYHTVVLQSLSEAKTSQTGFTSMFTPGEREEKSERERARERGRGAAWLGVREYYLIYYLFILLFIKSTVKYQPCKMEIHGKILI